MFIKVLYKLTAISLLISACSNESSFSPAATPNEGNEFILSGETVSGVSQKGPFIKGSTVTLYELDEKLNQTGIHYSTTIDNDNGKYHIDSVILSKPYAWMIVKGNFIDEITGKKSTNPITLNGLVKVEKNKDININILSHLAFNRIQFLVQQGLSISQAQKQAEVEVLKAFNIDDDGTPFENMDIFANGEGDAKLLAITLILLNAYEGDIAKTTDLLAQITYDLETDGVWNDTNLIENLEYRTYESTEDAFISARKNMKSITTQSIPEFEKYINKFISLNHSGIVWGHCNNESELQKNRGELRICHDSLWVNYTGFRKLKDPIVDTTGKFGTLVDTRDNHVYKTLTLKFDNGDSAIWMAENLQLKKSEYTIEEVNQDLCPNGWHISSFNEWQKMFEATEVNYQYGELLFNQGFEYGGSDHPEEKCYFISEKDPVSSFRTICSDGHSQDYAKIRCIKDYIEPITDTSKYGTLTDKRDGRTYKTLDIELPDGTTATWMASLLEYDAKENDSILYHIPDVAQTYTYKQILNKPDDADTTELYPILIAAENGEKIQGICPENYHVPNHQDWDNLLSVTKENEQIKKMLLHTQRSFNKTTNEYEFINESLKFNFDITGSLVREHEECYPIGLRPNHPITCHTYTLPPYSYTDIETGMNSYISPTIWLRTPNEFVLRCVKD